MEINKILKINKHQVLLPKIIIDEFQEIKKKSFKLNSGSRNLNNVLGGGFCSGRKYLIFGANRTGKTQIAHQICLQAFKCVSNIKGIANNNCDVYYFDTENTFRPERLIELALNAGFENTENFENIFVSKIMSNSSFILSLKNLEKIIEKSHKGVLIIDTINNYYNLEKADKFTSLNKAKTRFIKILELINTLTHKFNLITIVLAQVTSNLNDKMLIPIVPVGYHILNHYFSEYIFLEYKDENQRYIQLVNSLELPERKLTFKITSSGIQDYII